VLSFYFLDTGDLNDFDDTQEATVFANPYFGIETAQLIESLDTNVKLRWVMAGKDLEPYVPLNCTKTYLSYSPL